MSVSGAGSSFTAPTIFVGLGGNGTLSVTATPTSPRTRAPSIANGNGSTGSVTITGAGSSWSNTGTMMTVGTSSTGSLTISDGAIVTTGAAHGRRLAGDGPRARHRLGLAWTATGSGAKIGNLGDGSLTVSGGGTAAFGQVEIGSEAGSARLGQHFGQRLALDGHQRFRRQDGNRKHRDHRRRAWDGTGFVRLGGGIFTTGTGTGVMTVDGAGSLQRRALCRGDQHAHGFKRRPREPGLPRELRHGHAHRRHRELRLRHQPIRRLRRRADQCDGRRQLTAKWIKQSVLNACRAAAAPPCDPNGTDTGVSVVQNLALGGSPSRRGRERST